MEHKLLDKKNRLGQCVSRRKATNKRIVFFDRRRTPEDPSIIIDSWIKPVEPLGGWNARMVASRSCSVMVDALRASKMFQPSAI